MLLKIKVDVVGAGNTEDEVWFVDTAVPWMRNREGGHASPCVRLSSSTTSRRDSLRRATSYII